MKKLLILGLTHGNEKIGQEVFKQIRKKNLAMEFDFLIANIKAAKQGKRFVDFDLNRAYPGDEASPLYEKRRAVEILDITRKYEFVLDLHEASEGINDFIIVPREKIGKKFPIGMINLKNILLWPSPKGPLGSVADNVVELEFGMKSRQRKDVINKATRIVGKFIQQMAKNTSKKYEYSPRKNQTIFYVYGKLLTNRELPRLRDFQEIQMGDERFFPLLVDQYKRLGIKCYKMRRVYS